LAKLSNKQWKEIETRLTKGEKAIELAKEYKITRGAISQKFSKQQKDIKALANQIVNTEISIQNSPVTIQMGAFSLANELLSISKHMATGANNSAMNYGRLSSIATKQLAKLDVDNLDEAELAMARTLTIMSNEAAKTPMDLIKANQNITNAAQDTSEVTFESWRKGSEGKVIGIVNLDN